MGKIFINCWFLLLFIFDIMMIIKTYKNKDYKFTTYFGLIVVIICMAILAYNL